MVLVLLVAVVAIAAVVVACTTPSTTPGTTGTPFMKRFLSTYVGADGRVTRPENGNDTVSEGQAYALLVSAAASDAATFDKVWQWTKHNLERPDGLFSWHWRDGQVLDQNSATDADVDIAHALVIGARVFNRLDYLDEARRVAKAVLDVETIETGGRLVLVAGPWARDSRTVNPSYLAPCAFAELATATGDSRWTTLHDDGIALVRDLTSNGQLPPDWATVDDRGHPQAAPAPDQAGAAPQYGLDAARIPLRFGACDGDGHELAAALWTRLRSLDKSGGDIAYALDGRPVQSNEHAVSYLAASAAARAAGDARAASDLRARAENADRTFATYYGAAWLALTEPASVGSGEGQGSVELISFTAPAQASTTTSTTTPSSTTAPSSTTTTTGSTSTTSPSTSTSTTGSTTTTTTAEETSTTAETVPSSGSDGSGAGVAPRSPRDQSSSQSGTAAATGVDPRPPSVAELIRPDTPVARAQQSRSRRTSSIIVTGVIVAVALALVLGLRERSVARARAAAEET